MPDVAGDHGRDGQPARDPKAAAFHEVRLDIDNEQRVSHPLFRGRSSPEYTGFVASVIVAGEHVD